MLSPAVSYCHPAFPAIYSGLGLPYNRSSACKSSNTTMEAGPSDVTLLLREIEAGVPDAEARLLAIVFSELRKIAAFHLRRDRSGHTLQPTALVNEAYLRLTRANLRNLTDRDHFFAIASRAMRRVLVDYARARHAQKRASPVNGQLAEIPLRKVHCAEDFLALDEALSRLSTWDERQSQIVELRFFGGLTEDEVASMLNISVRTVRREWAMARAWLQSQLER